MGYTIIRYTDYNSACRWRRWTRALAEQLLITTKSEIEMEEFPRTNLKSSIVTFYVRLITGGDYT